MFHSFRESSGVRIKRNSERTPFTRLLKTRWQPTTGFTLFRAHQPHATGGVGLSLFTTGTPPLAVWNEQTVRLLRPPLIAYEFFPFLLVRQQTRLKFVSSSQTTDILSGRQMHNCQNILLSQSLTVQFACCPTDSSGQNFAE
ncbi:hypothetical protein CSKR_114108 [Clonorchis sinensis]|uniref:Uncharacterized protein n=1 Tax=Clonorchis sinensis TaxID=79923 RepID=A0A3R7FDX6_CLOSI|nr:hypothetical protein CSKR_114108 [Clonorchis sinensis]